jgi:hypothetical protein
MEEYKWRVLEHGAESNICTEEGEIIRGWRNLHNEEFHNLYPSSNIITATT